MGADILYTAPTSIKNRRMYIDTESLVVEVHKAYLYAKECWDVSESWRTDSLAKKTIEKIERVLVADCVHDRGLVILGYTKHQVNPNSEESYWVHPEYVELFKNGYIFDPDLGVPEWAVITL
jgi:hypothetical protein